MAKGKRGGSFFDYDTLSPALKRMLPKVDAAVELVMEHYAGVAESEMRQGARWTDRTGNARNSLAAQAGGVPMVERTLTLYGGMPYSIWLEVRWGGKYAIIGPTMLGLSEQVAAATASAVYRATRG